jgi:hypothetical protein
MSAFAVVVAVAMALLSLDGFAEAGVWVGVGLLVVGGGFYAERTRLLRRGRDVGREAPPHRKSLDRIVLVQWLGAALVGGGFSLACLAAGLSPLSDTGRLVDALIVGLAVGSVGVFVSSLVDWYVILPKVSGIARLAPCEQSGGTRWKYTTDIWYFHRAVATALVYLAATGIPVYMGSTASGSAVAAWGVVSTIVAAAGAYFFRAMFLAGWYAFNPPVLVGDQIFVDVPEEGDGDVRVHRRRAYVLDVSLQGVKYKVLHDGRYTGGRFVDRDDGNVPNHKLSGVKAPRKDDEPICPKGKCTGVNWYCRHNSKAHD